MNYIEKSLCEPVFMEKNCSYKLGSLPIVSIKLPRKLKKKIYGTRTRPRIFINLAQGKDFTVEAHILEGKIIEIWRHNNG